MSQLPEKIRVMVVDDHSLFRRGLTALLAHEEGLDVVGEASDGSEALRHVAALRPDVMLLDNHMPGVRGVDLLPGLLEAAPETRFIMLTVSEDEDDLAAALRAGAVGYLLKTIDGQELAAAIRRAVCGESVVSPEMTHKLVRAFKASVAAPTAGAAASGQAERDAALATLSPREQDILREIARGASNKEIARALDIAETTVKIHVQHILRKLDLSSRVQVAVWASERGLFSGQ
ncbi:response regulator [Paucibacter soli]|uniref:response regulator n=1 Tax=Paucibacter soli TaxID=3133433 RepID=UPI0030B108EC